MKYEKPKLLKVIKVLPRVTVNFAPAAAQTCEKQHDGKNKK